MAVGGTVLNSDGGNPPQRFSGTAREFGGGGNSTNEPAGCRQQGVAPLHCATDQSGNPYMTGTAPLCRATPAVPRRRKPEAGPDGPRHADEERRPAGRAGAADPEITPGPNSTVDVDVPLANIGAPAAGQILQQPSAQAYVREGFLAGPLEPVDSAGPNADFAVG